MPSVSIIVVLTLWVASGVIPALVMMRRGHYSAYWVLIGIGLGPFTAPVLWERMQDDAAVVTPLAPGSANPAPGLAVLVALDGSAASANAARWAAAHFGPLTAEMTFATAVDFDADEVARTQASALLHDLASSVPHVDPRLILLTGNPVDALLRVIDDDSIDVVVIGPRGTGMKKALLGSVAEGLLSKAGCSVLVVPGNPAGP